MHKEWHQHDDSHPPTSSATPPSAGPAVRMEMQRLALERLGEQDLSAKFRLEMSAYFLASPRARRSHMCNMSNKLK